MTHFTTTAGLGGPNTDASSGRRSLKAWLDRARATRAFRTVSRFGARRGSLLAAGMSYQALFAIFAALWLGFSAAGLWLAANPDLLDSVIATLNRAVPGLIGSGGATSRSSLLSSGVTLGWTGIIAAAGLIATTIGWLSSTRLAIRAMFDLGPPRGNAALQKLRDLALGLGFGILLIAASLLSLSTAALLGGLYELVGIGSASPLAGALAQAASFVVTTLVNTAVLAAMYRVLSALTIPWRALLATSLAGGAALAVMSSLSGLLLGGAHKNPLAASFAVILGLLIWFNLLCRVVLLCASWLAVDLADQGRTAETLTPDQEAAARHARELDARIVLAEAALRHATSDAAAAHWPHRASTRRRADTAARQLEALHDERDLLRG